MHGKTEVCLKIHYIMIGKRVGSYFKSSAINLEFSTNLIQSALASPSSKKTKKHRPDAFSQFQSHPQCFHIIPAHRQEFFPAFHLKLIGTIKPGGQSSYIIQIHQVTLVNPEKREG